MAGMVTVYDADGKAIELDGVDARDYLATGRYTSAPVDEAQAVADQAVREHAAAVMTPEKDAAAIAEASPKAAPKAKVSTRKAVK